ncbi:MAG: protein-S-isoprenylcysteine O-methyltransferase [Planctomycetota bacterium]|nr:protein-S-isoprenylcysteine O-methyltransferase [Planctomycetota bacterium]
MNVWFAKIAVLVSLLVYLVIRWPHGNRSSAVKVTEDRKSGLEIALLMQATIGTTLIPVLWMTTHLFAFADYHLYALPYALGLGIMVVGLWLFYRSHTDLGTNWSVTLKVRENHTLVTSGVYSAIRHPMYSSMFLLGIAHLLFLPNWFAGPAYLLSFGVLYLFRVRAEERLMHD